MEREQSGAGGVWRRVAMGVVVISLLGGCASQETIKKRTRESDGYYQQGLSFLGSDQQRAFVAFQKAVQVNPDNYDAHYALGSVYHQRKEYAEAEREFRACIELDPHSGEALNYLGRTLIDLKRLPEAIETLRKATALPLYGTPDVAYTNLGDALYRQGDLPGAIRAFQDAAKVDPPNVPRALLYLSVGRLYMEQGEDGKAREALAQAKALDPGGTAGAEASRLMGRLRKP
jgi:type IV pilus biogenesis/stability protein PilW